MKSSRVSAPIVFEYLDVLSYLQDYYSFRKRHSPRFSYEVWSSELGLNNRSFLRMLVMGKKKITVKFFESFSGQSLQTAEEKNYFDYLIRYSQAKNMKERQAYGQTLMSLLKGYQQVDLVEDYNDFVSDPLLPRLFALMSFEDVTMSVHSAAKMLNLSLQKAEAVLKGLQDLKLVESLQENGEIQWRATSSVFRVPDNFGSLNLMKFHTHSLQEAMQAFHLPKETRRYKSLLLPMDAQGMTEFNTLLDRFAAEQMVRFNSKTYAGKRMFQVNFNIYPVAEPSQE